MRLFFTIGVSLLSVASGSNAAATFDSDQDAAQALIDQANTEAAMREIRKRAIANAATAADYASSNTSYHRGNSRTPTSSPSEAPTSAPTSAPTQVPSESPTRNVSVSDNCADDDFFRYKKVGLHEDNGKQYWYDNNGCRPLKEEVWCPTAPDTTTDGFTCKGKCVTYKADGSHCVEVNISGFHVSVTGESGGFHAYPNCSSLDDDTTWGEYNEGGVLMTDLKSKTWFNTSVEHTDLVPGWYWCQKKMKCLHPQALYHTAGHDSSWVGTCGDEGSEGNWDDHIFEAADSKLFDPSSDEFVCNGTSVGLEGKNGEPDIFPPLYKEHCQIHTLPSGNSYSQKKATQCASGKVDGCQGAVAFYFSIAGFGHNYNFNFCLSKVVNGTKRSNDWDNGITPTPAPTPPSAPTDSVPSGVET